MAGKMMKVPVEADLKEALQRHAPHVGCVPQASLLKDGLGPTVALVRAPDLSKSKSVVLKYGYDLEDLNRVV